MQQCFGMCEDGSNVTMFLSVARWVKCNSVLECAKIAKIQHCFGVCQDGPNATMFLAV